MIVMILISQLIPDHILREPVFLFIILLVFAALFSPTRNRLRRLLDKVFLGGTYDLPWVVSNSSSLVSESRSLAGLAEELFEVLRKLHFSGAAFMIPKEKEFSPEFHYGIIESDLKFFRLPLHGILSSQFLTLEHAVWIDKIRKPPIDPKFEYSELTFLNFPSAVIVVPISSKSVLRGILILRPEFEQDWLSDHELLELNILSNLVSVAIENAVLIDSINVLDHRDLHLQEAIQEHTIASGGTENKYQSIARELHDGPIQELVGFGFELKKINFHSKEQEGVYEHRLNSIIRELRDICADLRPASLYLGVPAAVQSLVLRFQENYPEIQFYLAFSGNQVEVTGELKLAIYRITQETLNNIVHHANARHAWIDIQYLDGQIQIDIQDDGCGFVIPDSWFRFAAEGHFGLIGISERVQTIGGLLDLSSEPGKGTHLRVFAPSSLEDDMLVSN
jgi:signal transduction histidine kinase